MFKYLTIILGILSLVQSANGQNTNRTAVIVSQMQPTIPANQTSPAAQTIPRYSTNPNDNPWGLSIEYYNEFNDNRGNYGASFVLKSMNPHAEINDHWKFYFRFPTPYFKILDRGNAKSLSIMPAINKTIDSRDWFVFEPSEPFDIDKDRAVKISFRGGYDSPMDSLKSMAPSQILWEYNPIINEKLETVRAMFQITISDNAATDSPSPAFLQALKGGIYPKSMVLATVTIPILVAIGIVIVTFLTLKRRFYSNQDSKYM